LDVHNIGIEFIQLGILVGWCHHKRKRETNLIPNFMRTLLIAEIVFQGSVNMLIAWISTTVFLALIAVGFDLYYIGNSLGSTDHYSLSDALVLTYTMVTNVFITGYFINVALYCTKLLKAKEALEPIGKGFRHLLNFYWSDPVLTGKLLLICEVV